MAASASELTDEQLAALVQQGDKEKFALLMDRYEQKLLRYGRRFLSDPASAEDAVQDVFIKTFQNIKSFDAAQRFSPWIYRIAHNTFVNEIRKRARTPLSFIDFDLLVSHPASEETPLSEVERSQARAALERGLKKLPPKYREVLTLYYFEELSYKEISDILRVPTGTVGVRLKRAREALKKHLPEGSSYV